MKHQPFIQLIGIILLLSIHSKAFAHVALTTFGNQTQVVFEFSEVVTTGGDTRAKAMVFRSITFIDSLDSSDRQYCVWYSNEKTLQGAGWFENEV